MTVTNERPVREREPQPDAYTAPGLTLPVAARIFVRTFSAWVLIPAVVISVALRLALGGWRWWDLGIAAIILGFQPFTEWLIHVFVLHFTPRRVAAVTIDPLGARRHRQHHADPKVLGLVLVPRQILLTSVVLEAPIMWAITPTWRLALSGMATAYSMFLAYEWIHFLIHSTYKPKRRYYTYVYRAHRLHHYRNEKYWFGVTVHLADHVLRTFPQKDEVPVSPTAFNLGVTEHGINEHRVGAAL